MQREQQKVGLGERMGTAPIKSFLVARYLIEIDRFHHNRQPPLDPRVIGFAIKPLGLRLGHVVSTSALRPTREKMFDGITNDSHETTTPYIVSIHLLSIDLSLNRRSAVLENFSS